MSNTIIDFDTSLVSSVGDMDDDAIRRALALLNLRDKRIEFATKYHTNTNGGPLIFDKRFAYMREIYETLAQKIVLMSGTQLGKSEFLTIDILAASYIGLSSMMCFPKMDFRARFVKEKIKRPLNLSPAYKAILKESLSDAIDLINFGKGMISFVSANNSQDFTSYSAHAYYVEELDQADSIENVNLGFARMDGSIYKLSRLVANPLTTAEGRIHWWYEKSDKRIWKCPCKQCGKTSDLDWFTTVVEELRDEDDVVIGHVPRDTEWSPGCGRDMRIMCPHCKIGDLDRYSESCHWEATAFSDEGITGYHMPSIISTIHEVSKLWFEFKDALNNPTKMGKFYSTKLALPFSHSANNISVGLLQRCAEEGYDFTILPDQAFKEDTHEGPCSMGIDQNSTNFDIRISCIDKGKRRGLYLGKIPIENEYMLHDLVERYNVIMAVIDNEPNTTVSKAFQDKARCDVWRCKYKGTKKHSERTDNYNEMILSVHRTEALDKAYSQLKTRRNIIPANFEHIFKGLYAEEMQDLSRKVVEEANGDLIAVWTKSQRDHAFHADAMDLLAWEFVNEDMILGDDCVSY